MFASTKVRVWFQAGLSFFCFCLFLSVGMGQPVASKSEAAPLGPSRPYRQWRWAFDQRSYPLGYLPQDAKARALGQIKAAESTQPKEFVSGNLWVNVGPAPAVGGQIGINFGFRPMSGRTDSVAVNPGNSNHWLVGAATGGVWESIDAGTNWVAKTDDQASLATGAIAFAPGNSNIIYVGTGAGVYTSDSYAGAGLLKSSDGAHTWQLLAPDVFANNSFSRLRVNPTNDAQVTAAVTWGFFGRDGNYAPSLPPRGLFLSADGGTNWSLTLQGEGTALEADPGNFQRQYAGLGNIFGSASNGVFRSTNAGGAWTRISGPWTTTPGGIGRVELAMAPSNPNVLYASIQDSLNSTSNDGGLLGLWRTTNAWATTPAWTKISVAATDDGSGTLGYCGWDPAYQSVVYACWFAHRLSVDPTNSNILYAGGVALWKYNGSTWTEVSKTVADPAHGIHADQHAMAWAGNRLIVGNDGGVWSTTNGGTTWNDHNSTLSTIAFFEGSLHPTQPNFALAGSQDNGTTRWAGTNGWPMVQSDDGSSTAISSNKPGLNWAVSREELLIYRTLNGGTNFTQADGGINKTNAPFIGRFKESPVNDNYFIAGTDNLWRCTNFFSGTPAWVANGPKMGSSVSAMAFAFSDRTSRTYAFGTATGQLRVTTNSGTLWRDADAGNTVPNRYITDIAFHPINMNILYATLSGFDEGTPGQPGHVFVTSNALAASPMWMNISPPVNLPHNCVALDPVNIGMIYVGTDVGIWRSADSGSTWIHMGPANGMPNVPVFDLKINATTGRTMAFTHGRGAFALVDGSLAGQLQVTSFQLGATNVRIGFSSDLNQRYRIERSGRLPATAWTNVADNIPGTGAIIQTNDVRLPGPQFYRVRRL